MSDLQYYINVPVKKELQELIYKYGKRIEVANKKFFIKPGDTIFKMHYIDQGMLMHYAVSEEGVEKSYYISPEGGFINECLYSVHGTSVIAQNYVITKAPSVLYEIDRTAYIELMKYPIFIETLQYSFYQKYKKLQYALDNVCFNTARDRLINLYVVSVQPEATLIDQEWLPMKMHYKQQELATIIGVHRASIGRLISELCRDGCIRIVNRKTQIRKDIIYAKWKKE
ncbi:MAG: helix-turn-helix domain-containing protein [Lachnospiraceae bacterium]